MSSSDFLRFCITYIKKIVRLQFCQTYYERRIGPQKLLSSNNEKKSRYKEKLSSNLEKKSRFH